MVSFPHVMHFNTGAAASRSITLSIIFGDASIEHYATISLDLLDHGDETELRMECRGVPSGEEDSTREGWTRFYFQAIKQTFGY